MDKKQRQQARNCLYCGGPYPHKGGRDACPASGQTCSACSKTGHFAKCCLSKPRQAPRRREVREITEAEKPEPYLSDTDEEFIYSINASSIQQPETITQIANIPVKVIIDTGSSVNLLNNSIFHKIKRHNLGVKLETCHYRVFPYGANEPIELLGQFTAEIKSDNVVKTDTFLVTKANSKCLLSYKTSTALALLDVKVHANSLQHANPEITQILHKHKDLFEGMGNIKNIQVTLDIDPSVQPVAQRPYRIPHSMKATVNNKLDEMRDQGIIEKVEGSTPWLSPLIAIPKKGGDVRLVLDMRVPNQAFTRRRVQMPTVDEILQKMEGAKVFTEVDLSQGYLQVTLAEESRYITAFQTPDDGPHRFTRLIMGACPSGEYFHEVINQIIRDVPNCENISDNIWLWSQDMAEHAKQLDQLLGTLQENGITLKLPKCSFGVPEINVFGHIVSGQGIRPDNKKTEAIGNAPKPKCASEVRSFLGLTN